MALHNLFISINNEHSSNIKSAFSFFIERDSGSVLMFTVIDMVPKYLSDVHDYHLISDGFLSGLPFIANFTIGALACILVG